MTFTQHNSGNATGYQTVISAGSGVNFVGEFNTTGKAGQTQVTVNVSGAGPVSIDLETPLESGETRSVQHGSMTVNIKVC